MNHLQSFPRSEVIAGKASAWARHKKERQLFRNEQGAIDLASVMVGIIVMAIIGGVVAATVFAVIPWTHDKAAREAVNSVKTAEDVSKVKDGAYVDMAGLKRKSLLTESDNVTVATNPSGSCYAVASRSETGRVFYATSKNDGVTEDRSKVTWCAGLPARASVLEEIAATSIASSASGAAIERGHVTTALVTVRDKHQDEKTAWTGVAGTATPSSDTDFSISFDHGQGDDWGVPEVFGTRTAVVTAADSGKNYIGIVFTHDGRKAVCELSKSTITTAAGLLAAVGDDLVCPNASPIMEGSAMKSVWAWGNSVDPASDARGLGYDSMTPEAIVKFAKARNLDTVYLNVPWAADNEGPIKKWIADTVAGLHAENIKVGALGGDYAWVENPALGAQWVTSALNTAPFDSIQSDVEPWTHKEWADNQTATATKYVTLMDTMKQAAASTSVGIDVPYWLATTPYGSGTLLSAILPFSDTVAVVAFKDYAEGPAGIIELSTPAVNMVSAAGKPFTIGVETDTPQVAGGPQYTFYEEGSAVLEAETKKVEGVFSSKIGYRGVTVEHLRSWGALS